MIHEYGHQHGIPHPFDDQVGQGTFGGIMDYGDSRLILPDPNAGRQAFSQTTDANAFCADMTDLLQRSNENNCWVVDDDQLFPIPNVGMGILIHGRLVMVVHVAKTANSNQVR